MLQFDEVRRRTLALSHTVVLIRTLAEKYLQAVQALSRAKALDVDNPDLHVRIVHLRHTSTQLLLLVSARYAHTAQYPHWRSSLLCL